MKKYLAITIIAIALISCKKNTSNSNNDDFKETVTDTIISEDIQEETGITMEDLEAMSQANSSIKDGTYTDREKLKDIISDLGFEVFSTLSFSEDHPYLQLIELSDDKTSYKRVCIYKDWDRMVFEIGSGKENQTWHRDSIPYPIMSISNQDTYTYYIDKIYIFKEGSEVEMHMYPIETNGVNKERKVTLNVDTRDDMNIVSFYDSLYATNTDAEQLEITICDEPERG